MILTARAWPVLCLAAAGSAYAQAGLEALLDETVVTATRTPSTVSATASSVTVISAAEIRARNKPTIQALLRTVPGLDVVSAGGPGGQTSIFARGTESNHVLVLLDGIEAGDPSNFNNQFDFGLLAVDDIERIEIVRGAQSTLYGSDAIGGVINIITRRDAGHAGVDIEAGSFSSLNVRARAHGENAGLSYGFSTSFNDTDGYSAADEAAGNGEADGASSVTLSAYLRYAPGPDSAIDLSIRNIDSESRIDDFNSSDFSFADDTDRELFNDILLARVGGQLDTFERRWRHQLALSWTRYDRRSINGAEPGNSFASDETFAGDKLRFEWQNQLSLAPQHGLSFGVDVERDQARTWDELAGGPPSVDASATSIGIHVQDQLTIGRMSTSIGVRHDDHEQFGGQLSWRLTPLYALANDATRLRASVGQGFKAPALQELFAPFFGNPDLQPEISRGWDFGVDHELAQGRARISATWFDNRIEELIGFDPQTFQAINVDQARSEGLELVAGGLIRPTLRLDASYTHTRAKNVTTGADLLRRPRSKASLTLNYAWQGRANLNLEVRHVGERDDVGGRLPAYEVVDLAASLNLGPASTLTLRLENLLDEDYQEILGFGTADRAAYAGIRYAFADGG